MSVQERIQKQVTENRVVLYMKGTPDAPQCGFSARAVQLLEACGAEEVDFRITVWEFVKPRDPAMTFFAQADKQTNQKTAPFTPSGWGRTLLDALGDCIKEIHRFPYEGS